MSSSGMRNQRFVQGRIIHARVLIITRSCGKMKVSKPAVLEVAIEADDEKGGNYHRAIDWES